ncbi:MAG: tannase/feruloyl esterase family alpha/beta hydrolase [Burkholderiales bacterium]
MNFHLKKLSKLGSAVLLIGLGVVILAACAKLPSLPDLQNLLGEVKLSPTEARCAALIDAIKDPDFPVVNSRITVAKINAVSAGNEKEPALPEHCLVQGIAGAYVGADKVRYGAGFELRLPLDWNGRFMFQGGGGTEGTVPAAIGVAGTLSPTLAKGWAVVSQNGGHDNAVLIAAGKSTLDFLLEPRAFSEHASGSIDKTARVARFLIRSFYGRLPDRSYHVGCSTGGRQGMVFSQQYPEYFDGIVAGDPVYDLTALTQGEVNSLQAIAALTTKDAAGNARFYEAFSIADQNLATRAILDACDAADGALDGIVNNLPACRFDPATHVFKNSGQPLQCTGAKTASCLSPAQVDAIKRINLGPRTSAGSPVVVPSGTRVEGYPYDGGFMAPNGIPVRNIGTAKAPPGNINLGTNQIGYYIRPPTPRLEPYKSWNFNTDPAKIGKDLPIPALSADLSAFKRRGGKMIFYHGVSDPGPSVHYTINYFNRLAPLNSKDELAKLYLVPNMGHCRGGPAPDQFDFLTPLVDWVERGIAPDTVIASGRNFASAPVARTHPLCAYPKIARYTGLEGGNVGDAANFTCQIPN